MIFGNKQEEEEIKEMILNKKFNIAYQPIISTKEGSVKYLESLFRLQNAKYNNKIEEIIKFSEEEGLLDNITCFMLDNVIEDFEKWKSDLIINEDFKISINISPKQLNKKIMKLIDEKINKSSMNPENLSIEITETHHVLEENIVIINEMYNKGYKIALDDFRTGFSSLTHLIKMPYHMVKIDKNFIKNILESKSLEKELIKMIVGLSKTSDFKVVCEGIETASQAGLMTAIDCDYQQGFLYSKPVFKNEIVDTIRKINQQSKICNK